MSFDRITRLHVAPPRLSGVSLTAKMKEGRLNLAVTISAELLKQSELVIGDYVYLGLGRGEDAGRFAVERGATKADGFRLSPNSNSASARLQFTAARLDGDSWPALERTAAEAVAEPGRVVVTLPAALRRCETPDATKSENPDKIATPELGSGPMPSPHPGGDLVDGAGETPCGAPEPDAEIPEPASVVRDERTSAPPEPSRRVPRDVPEPVAREERKPAARPSPWTPAEDQILRREWAAGSATDRIASLLPKRSKSAIAFRASTLKLGVRMPAGVHSTRPEQREMDPVVTFLRKDGVKVRPGKHTGMHLVDGEEITTRQLLMLANDRRARKTPPLPPFPMPTMPGDSGRYASGSSLGTAG